MIKNRVYISHEVEARMSRVFDRVNQRLDSYNMRMHEQLLQYSQITKNLERVRIVGQNVTGFEIGPPASRSQMLGFPLDQLTIPLPWTLEHILASTDSALMGELEVAIDEDRRQVWNMLASAIFNPINREVKDRYVDWVTLPVRALCNGDSFPIPDGFDGQTYNPATHTHYGYAPLELLDQCWSHGEEFTARWYLNEVISDQFFHYGSSNIKICTSKSLAKYIVPLLASKPVPEWEEVIEDIEPGQNFLLGTFVPYQKDIFVEVFVEGFVPENYLFGYDPQAPRPLALRERRKDSHILSIMYEDDHHPLISDALERSIGFGVQERTSGFCMHTSSIRGYVAPQFPNYEVA